MESFNAKEFDEEGAVNGAGGIDAYHFGARMYDPVTGMWFSTDPADQTWNAYGYCGGNPVNNIDPTGTVFGWDDAIIIAVAVAAYYIGNSMQNQSHGMSASESWNIFSGNWWAGSPENPGTGALNNMQSVGVGYTQGMGAYAAYAGERNYPGWENKIANSGNVITVHQNVDLGYELLDFGSYSAPSDLYFNGLPFQEGAAESQQPQIAPKPRADASVSLKVDGSSASALDFARSKYNGNQDFRYCDIFVQTMLESQGYNGPALRVQNWPTKDLPSSGLFRRLNDPTYGDLQVWRKDHVNFYLGANGPNSYNGPTENFGFTGGGKTGKHVVRYGYNDWWNGNPEYWYWKKP